MGKGQGSGAGKGSGKGGCGNDSTRQGYETPVSFYLFIFNFFN